MTLSPAHEALLGNVGIPTQGTLRIAGPDYYAARAVQEVLQDNHVKYDWQFTGDGLHNHLSHAVLASYSMGASPDLIKDIYELHSKAQRPMCPLLKKVSFQNWTRWLGNDEYYSSYLVFFTEEIQKYGAPATLERYLFKVKEGKLLLRTVSGAIHPLIQIGHGVEFGLDALVAEGLAQACVHSAQVEGLFAPGWPNLSQSNSAFASAFSHFKSMKSPVAAFSSSKDSFTATISRLDPARPRHPRLGLSGFTVLGHMLKDPRLAAGQAMQKDDFPRLGSAIKNRGDLMRAWCEEWVIDPDGGWTEVCEKLEEIFWIATVLVGASSRPGYKPRMDFFMMHALTSAIFLPGMLEVLSPNSRISLLHSHFRVMVAYWVSRGRPHLYIEEVLMSANAYPESPDAVSYEQGAVQRGIRKGGTEEVTIKEKAEQKEEEKAAEEADVPESQKEDKEDGDATTAANRSRSASGSSVVDVSLDSPAREKEEPTFGNAEPAQTLSVNEEPQDGNEDGLKTPTTANGWTHSRPPSDGSDEASVRDNKRKPQSSAATWSSIISSAVDHTDEHVTKMIRSLAFAAQNFGMAPPGIHTSSLPGSDALDGTVFIRLAGILLQTMGWEHEGQEAGSWDRTVLGFDEAWQDEARDGSGSQEGNGSVAHPKEKDSYESRVEDTQPDPGLFERREDYPRKLDKGKGRAADQDD